MAGYSKTPLPSKLGIHPEQRVRFHRLPAGVRAELGPILSQCPVAPVRGSAAEFAMLFARSRAELREQLDGFHRSLAPRGILWICWRKHAAGVTTDVHEAEVRSAGLATGLVDVKVCAIDTDWSGLKFVHRARRREAPSSPRRRRRTSSTAGSA